MVNNATSKKRHNELICAVVGKFLPAFSSGGTVLYRKDRSENQVGLDDVAFGGLGLSDLKSDGTPDVIIHDVAKNRLFLFDTVPGHGPINAKRRDELTHIFKDAKPGLVYVTAFLNRSDMTKYVGEISWATEVWVADAESHLIHI